MTSKDMHYEMFPLPRAVDDAEKWLQLRDKLKMLRLKSLQENPEAFSSTYAEEVKFSNEVWEKRMTNPLAVHLIAVGGSSKTESDIPIEEMSALLSGEWLGVLVLIGPKEDETVNLRPSRSPGETPSSMATLSTTTDREHASVPVYELNGVFVVTEARGLGLGKKLVDTVTELGISSAKSLGFREVRLRVRVDTGNRPARMLYRSGGYVECKVETSVSKGKEKDDVKIPSTMRTCIVMERLEELY
jgi:large subunit ribosomal protein L10Ae